MPVTRETLRLARELRVAVNTEVNGATRALVVAWARAFDDIRAELEAAVADLIAVGNGRWPTQGQIARAGRAERALRLAELSLRRLSEMGAVTITGHATTAAHLGAQAGPDLIVSQLPPAYAGARARFDLLSPDALQAIVTRTAEQITALTQPLSAEAYTAMRRQLIRGVVVGNNPRTAARQMVRGLEGRFNGGLTRAMVVARTEMLDAHRDGAAAQDQANSEVLAGWRWTSTLDRRACPSCWAQHGSKHPITEPGPQDHQQGRCARTPITKSWAELGINIKEPADLFPDAKAAFNRLPEKQQLQIMGPGRLEALQSGRIGWGDLSTRRKTRGWRDSHTVTPLRDLQRNRATAAA